MSQSFFNALFMGAKEPEGARKVVKFVSYYGFITVALGIALLFIPFEPLQVAIGKHFGSKWVFLGAAAVSYVCFFFMLKEKIWAPTVLLILEVLDFIVGFQETGDFFDSFSALPLLLYGSALHSIHYLKKFEKESKEIATPEVE
ncbi:hypothetical protein ACFOEK_10575 [Litoribrevibacter euphylliae]|uniref:Uncharacterized protein n=1 Tax=Litoribrevibacter euphylliae TaxID=1834034 RepID=A0ABV7HFI2_9GAMM